MSRRPLRFRTAKSCEEFAQKVAFLAWESLGRERTIRRPDPHRFPEWVQTLRPVLDDHINSCAIWASRAFYDPWSRTGGGPLGEHDQRPACRTHGQQLQSESAGELAGLLQDLESAALTFLSRHDARRANFPRDLPEIVHRAMESVIPYLFENLACSHCEAEAEAVS